MLRKILKSEFVDLVNRSGKCTINWEQNQNATDSEGIHCDEYIEVKLVKVPHNTVLSLQDTIKRACSNTNNKHHLDSKQPKQILLLESIDNESVINEFDIESLVLNKIDKNVLGALGCDSAIFYEIYFCIRSSTENIGYRYFRIASADDMNQLRMQYIRKPILLNGIWLRQQVQK